jgi:hypothetical protein
MTEIFDMLASDSVIAEFGKQLEADSAYWHEYLLRMTAPFDALILLRDWPGRFHLGIPRLNDHSSDKKDLVRHVNKLHTALGTLAAADCVFYSDDLIAPETIWEEAESLPFRWMRPDDTDRQTAYPAKLDSFKVRVIERQVKEKAWAQTPIQLGQTNCRVVLFGVKGGVGRSSALLALSWQLALKGSKVLVMDMDFESPGVSSSMLRGEDRPNYGLIDWFAANALDQNKGQELIDSEAFVARSSLNYKFTHHTQGEIYVAPAYGKYTQDYVGKLGRLYQDTNFGNKPGQGYCGRIVSLITALETHFQPDVVLIDSRAGIDDTASVLITQLGAHCFLLATSSEQTWDAYRLLFSHWQRKADLVAGGEDFRSYLKVVSALTPAENTAPGNFQNLCERSYDLFLEHLYEAQEVNTFDGFTFESNDKEAPHWPVRIFWNDALRNFDPLRFPSQLEDHTFKVFDEFLLSVEKNLEVRNGN